MTSSKKQVIFKAINVTAITTVIMLIIVICGYFKSEQTIQAQELSKVKEDVIILTQLPTLATIQNINELVKSQRKQIDINTKTLAVMDAQYKAINAKLDMIYDLVRDNNVRLYEHVEKGK